MNNELQRVISELEKAITGKRGVIELILTALLSEGHVLLDDVPGVGKTTLAVALSRVLGLNYRRVQFTPDVLPSDLVGFSVYDRDSGSLRYVPGALHNTNLLLGDEINRTSSKTQSALLEAMEERQITVDGTVYPLLRPFCVIATQNRVGTAGTQPLPHAQMDRFLIRVSLGYPDFEAQMEILRNRQTSDPLDDVKTVASQESVLQWQHEARLVHMDEAILSYITRLCMASRDSELLQLGISPRGALSVSRMARSCACLRGRDYVVVEDVQQVFSPVCAHRLILNQKARMDRLSEEGVVRRLLDHVKLPHR